MLLIAIWIEIIVQSLMESRHFIVYLLVVKQCSSIIIFTLYTCNSL